MVRNHSIVSSHFPCQAICFGKVHLKKDLSSNASRKSYWVPYWGSIMNWNCDWQFHFQWQRSICKLLTIYLCLFLLFSCFFFLSNCSLFSNTVLWFVHLPSPYPYDVDSWDIEPVNCGHMPRSDRLPDSEAVWKAANLQAKRTSNRGRLQQDQISAQTAA